MGRQPHLQPQPAGLGQPQAGGLAREQPTSLGAVCAGALILPPPWRAHATLPYLPSEPQPWPWLVPDSWPPRVAQPLRPHHALMSQVRGLVGVIYKFLQLLFGCFVAQQRNQLLLPAPPD